MRVYLDNCCYNRPYDDQSSLRVAMETQCKLKIQQMICDGALELAGSYILDFEVECNPYEAKRETIKNFIRAHMSVYVGPERRENLREIAQEIISSGVKEKDALHIASAIYAGCEYFISTDMRLLKYQTGEIKPVTPIEFITETEAE